MHIPSRDKPIVSARWEEKNSFPTEWRREVEAARKKYGDSAVNILRSRIEESAPDAVICYDEGREVTAEEIRAAGYDIVNRRDGTAVAVLRNSLKKISTSSYIDENYTLPLFSTHFSKDYAEAFENTIEAAHDDEEIWYEGDYAITAGEIRAAGYHVVGEGDLVNIFLHNPITKGQKKEVEIAPYEID